MKNKITSLYVYAEQHHIDIDFISTSHAKSMSIIFPDGETSILINPRKMDSTATEVVSVAHELGHCVTGSFYNLYSKYDIRKKHENMADKWAIMHLVPQDKLEHAVKTGHTEIWDLAEEFCVTEDFMRKAVCWYKNGNLDVDTC